MCLSELTVCRRRDDAEHPVDEALFNFALAWSLMLAPLMLLDPRARHIRERTRWLLWTGTMVRAVGCSPRLTVHRRHEGCVGLSQSCSLPFVLRQMSARCVP